MMMSTEELITIYSPLDSLSTDEYNALMQEMAADDDESKDAE